MGFIIFIHSVVCILISTIILMQSGRGGGLTETFASAESLFGAKTNVFLVKGTTVLASLFFVTCLSLAFLSSQQDKSLMSKRLSAPVPVQNLPDATQPVAGENSKQPVAGENPNSVKMDAKESTENANQNTVEVPPVTNSVQ